MSRIWGYRAYVLYPSPTEFIELQFEEWHRESGRHGAMKDATRRELAKTSTHPALPNRNPYIPPVSSNLSLKSHIYCA